MTGFFFKNVGALSIRLYATVLLQKRLPMRRKHISTFKKKDSLIQFYLTLQIIFAFEQLIKSQGSFVAAGTFNGSLKNLSHSVIFLRS